MSLLSSLFRIRPPGSDILLERSTTEKTPPFQEKEARRRNSGPSLLFSPSTTTFSFPFAHLPSSSRMTPPDYTILAPHLRDDLDGEPLQSITLPDRDLEPVSGITNFETVGSYSWVDVEQPVVCIPGEHLISQLVHFVIETQES